MAAEGPNGGTLVPFRKLERGDRIVCPGDGRIERVTGPVTRFHAFEKATVRTSRHDHFLSPDTLIERMA